MLKNVYAESDGMNEIRKALEEFLTEDIGKADVTSKLLDDAAIRARIVARERCIIAGLDFARQIFAIRSAALEMKKRDGEAADAGDVIAEIAGRAQDILSCERTALNLLSRMSGIATQTRRMVDAAGGKAEILATRKTAPGLRYFDKMAVEMGGGKRHRMSLNDAILIKDNHIAAAGSLKDIIEKAKRTGLKVEVEVENQDDAAAAASCGADTIMLDNFAPAKAAETITMLEKSGLRDGVKIELSGGINAGNISRYADAGADMISLGFITNSAKGIDFSLEV